MQSLVYNFYKKDIYICIYIYRSWQVFHTASCVRTELMNIGLCWLDNTGESIYGRPQETFTPELVPDLQEVLSISCSFVVQQRNTATLIYKNIICFFSFPFITQNIRRGKSEKENRRQLCLHTQADDTDLL